MRLIRSMIAITLLAAAAGEARAEQTLAIGTKWIPINFAQPLSVTAPDGASTVSLQSFNSQTIHNSLGGYFLLEGKLGFLLGLDLGFSSLSSSVNKTSTNLSYTQFGFSIGAKYYIWKPTAGHVTPYAYVDFYKYFAAMSSSAVLPPGTLGYYSGLASPLGIDAAGGAEYFFTPYFSIGAEVLGLKYSWAQGTKSVPSGFTGSVTTTGTQQYVTFYTGISLNYRFDLPTGRKRAAEPTTEETEEPKKEHPRSLPSEKPPEEQAPPSEPPPKEVEPVD
jgi:hypothetical protein